MSDHKHPDEFKDPTFTPLRENGAFKSVPPPPEQRKLVESDPDWCDINPDIVALAQRNGMARQCMEQYLDGQLSWLHALETMVVALGKELVRNQLIHVETRNEYLGLWKEHEETKKALMAPETATLSLVN